MTAATKTVSRVVISAMTLNAVDFVKLVMVREIDSQLRESIRLVPLSEKFGVKLIARDIRFSFFVNLCNYI